MRMPWRANIGLGFVMDRVGFISMQYEWVGLDDARYFFGSGDGALGRDKQGNTRKLSQHA